MARGETQNQTYPELRHNLLRQVFRSTLSSSGQRDAVGDTVNTTKYNCF